MTFLCYWKFCRRTKSPKRDDREEGKNRPPRSFSVQKKRPRLARHEFCPSLSVARRSVGGGASKEPPSRIRVTINKTLLLAPRVFVRLRVSRFEAVSTSETRGFPSVVRARVLRNPLKCLLSVAERNEKNPRPHAVRQSRQHRRVFAQPERGTSRSGRKLLLLCASADERTRVGDRGVEKTS